MSEVKRYWKDTGEVPREVGEHPEGDYVPHSEWLAAQRTIRELETERDALIADVREWACEKCNFVYPGPPQPGVRCVVCPRCGGSTMPHTTLRRRRAEAERDALREALTDAIECVEHWGDYANQYFKEKHDLAGDVARLRAALPPAPEAT